MLQYGASMIVYFLQLASWLIILIGTKIINKNNKKSSFITKHSSSNQIL